MTPDEHTHLRDRERAPLSHPLAMVATADRPPELADLLDGALHDLREPATYLAAFTEQLLSGAELAPARLARAHDASLRIRGLIDALRPFVRLARNAPVLERVELEDVLREVQLQLSVLVEETGATIAHDPLPPVTADRARLVLVLHQLLGNALRFRSQAPVSITVSASADEHGVRLVVADRGIGIEAEYLERVFLPFERLHAREVYPGHGLGLALCRHAVASLGGRIWAERRPGGGTCVNVVLPAAKEART